MPRFAVSLYADTFTYVLKVMIVNSSVFSSFLPHTAPQHQAVIYEAVMAGDIISLHWTKQDLQGGFYLVVVVIHLCGLFSQKFHFGEEHKELVFPQNQ